MLNSDIFCLQAIHNPGVPYNFVRLNNHFAR
jgi:hypothetical protein